MYNQVKQITLFTLLLFMGFSLYGQKIDTMNYSEADSLQDVKLKQLDQQLKSVNSRLRRVSQEQEEKTDSIELITSDQAEQISILSEDAENIRKMLQIAKAEIEVADNELLENRRKFKRALFISIPLLFIISLALASILFILLRKHRAHTDLQFNALRKYTHDGLEDVKAGYVDEIKRRVKKIAAKLKAGKKGKGKKKTSNANATKAEEKSKK